METWQGKHFSITDPEGVNTVIYQINKTPKEYLKEYPKYTPATMQINPSIPTTLTPGKTRNSIRTNIAPIKINITMINHSIARKL